MQNTPSITPEFSRPLRVSRLPRNAPHQVDETATPQECVDVAQVLDLLSLRKFRITGTLDPIDAGGWRFEGRIGATVKQACVVTLEPVQTRIDQHVSRIFLPQPVAHSGEEEIEIDPDDDTDPLSDPLDIGGLAMEELALALPAYPRADGAPVLETDDVEEDDSRPKPFAGLAALAEKMKDDGN